MSTYRFIEQLKIGGGSGAAACGESPNGGITLNNNGDISMDGLLTVGLAGRASGEIRFKGQTQNYCKIVSDATGETMTFYLDNGSGTPANRLALSRVSGIIAYHNLTPDASSSRSLGLSTKRWLAAYADSAEIGSPGATRGTLTAYHGAGGNTPGYLKLYSANGTAFYFFITAAGQLRYSSSVPTADTDGSAV